VQKELKKVSRILDYLGFEKEAEDLKSLAVEQLDIWEEPQQVSSPVQPESPLVEQPYENNRHDLYKAPDFSEYTEDVSTEVLMKLTYKAMLNSQPGADPKELLRWVVKQDFYSLRAHYYQLAEKFPRLLDDMPSGSQLSLPMEGYSPDIAFIPTLEDIESVKKKKLEEMQKKVVEWEQVVTAYKDAHPGEEVPSNSRIKSWRDRKTNFKNTIKPPFWIDDDQKRNSNEETPEEVAEIEIDYDIPAEHYKALEEKLIESYQVLNRKRTRFEQIVAEARLHQMETLSEPDPSKFKTLEGMFADIQKRLRYHIEKIVLNSNDISLFGAKTGYDDSDDIVRTFLDESGKDWYDNPGKIVTILQKKVKLRNYNHLIANVTVDDWFLKKSAELELYGDSIDRAEESFNRGQRFLKSFDRKLEAEIVQRLNGIDKKHRRYIEKNYKGFLDNKYLKITNSMIMDQEGATISEQLRNTSGMDKDSTYGLGGDKAEGGFKVREYSWKTFEKNEESAFNLFDISTMLLANNSQKSVIENFGELVLHTYQGATLKLNEDIIDPAIEQLISSLYNDLTIMATGYSQEQLFVPREEKPIIPEDHENLEIKHDDLRLLGVADKWLEFTKGYKNYQSLILYPKFVTKDKELRESLISGMKSRLGMGVIVAFTKKGIRNRVDNIVKEMWKLGKFRPKGSSIEEWVEDAMMKKSILLEPIIAKIVNMNLDLISSDSLGIRQSPNAITPPRFKELGSWLGESVVIKHKDKLGNRLEDFPKEELGRNALKHFMYNSGEYDSFHFQSTEEELYEQFVTRLRPLGTPYSHGLSFGDKMEQVYKWLMEMEPNQNKYEGDSPWMQDYYADKNAERVEKNTLILKLQKEAPFVVKQIKHLVAEINYSELFKSRMDAFGGVGPRAINNALNQNFSERALFKDLPIKQFFNKLNLAALEFISDPNLGFEHGSNAIVYEPTVTAFDEMKKPDRDIKTSNYIPWVVANHLDVKAVEQLERVHEIVKDHLPDTYTSGNYSNEEVKTWFPRIIGSHLEALHKTLPRAAMFCGWVHNNGANLSANFLRKVVENPNFKDWDVVGDGNEVVKQYFETVAKLKTMGGYTGIKRKYPRPLERLLKQGIIRKGFKKRLTDFARGYKLQMKLHPSAPDYEKNRQLISEVSSDLKAIDTNMQVSELDNKVVEKHEQAYNLGWSPANAKFRFRVLEDYDAYHFQVGHDTNCCQTEDGVGEKAMKDSYVNPLAGIVVLEVNLGERFNNWKSVSQSYFHYVPRDKGYILDNVEANSYKEELVSLVGYDIDQLYALWAKRTKEEYKDAGYILMGGRYTKVDEDKFKKQTLESDPRDFVYRYKHEGRSDWTPEDSYDLLNPKFEVPFVPETKKKAAIEVLVKTAEMLYGQGLKEEYSIVIGSLDQFYRM